jgi:peptide/nickel transport system permease protein
MGGYILKRIVAMVPVLVIVSVLVFLMIHFIPGDPVEIMFAESGASAERMEEIREQMGLNDPLPVQYTTFLTQMATGELQSLRTRQPVIEMFFNVFPKTMEIAIASIVIAVVIGGPLGIIAATRQHTWLDYSSMGISFVGVSIPNFWLALLLMYLFSIQLGWLPATGGQTAQHLILPAFVLAVQQAALIARLVRSSMVEILQEDYIKTARAKGVREWGVNLRHALRNAILPTITLIGLNFGYLLSGAVIVETVFARPGIGKLIIDAILAKDFPVVQGAILLTAVVYLIVNLLTDLSYAFIDPRIKYSG